MLKHQLRAILFDLDNTLTHRGKSIRRFSEYFSQVYQTDLVQIDIDVIEKIIHRIDQGGYPKVELLTHKTIGHSVAYALVQELHWQRKPDLDELAELWFTQFGLCAVLMAGAEQVLQQLKSQGFKLAIVSNGGHATRLKIIEGLGIQHYFDMIVSSESVGIKKPAPGIFQYVANNLQVLPQQCLFIGDHPVNDIFGARRAGMHALMLQGFHDQVDDQVVLIESLDEILQHIEFNAACWYDQGDRG
ncbi:HAD family hydrolase [Acinetobacter puyangensis]|uniref:Putative hydrolase of the HAD superfamily n=1 Tax=Acinetobacter puyangensis TaxID=1096779 RepID=A0A240E894_9GAMM|nr:HAD family hydrolase [Acinetobacter puyangensis]SNX44968.1 putative hydrolase of the HAD superfamily [Acinetobacter puyangensis]